MADYKQCEGRCKGTTYFFGSPAFCPIKERMQYQNGFSMSWEGEEGDNTALLHACNEGPGGLVGKVDGQDYIKPDSEETALNAAALVNTMNILTGI